MELVRDQREFIREIKPEQSWKENTLMNTEEEYYQITPLGLISIHVELSVAKVIADDIELYCRRNNFGIAVHENKLRFVPLVRNKKQKNEPTRNTTRDQ
jgi:hypothetical protein